MDPSARQPPEDPIGQTQATPTPATADGLDATRTSIGAEVDTLLSPPPRGQRGRYVIVKEHASGGLGTVSVAVDARLKRHVALKEIRPDRFLRRELRQRFITEAEITSLLEHPGIVPVYTFDEDEEGRPYYAMRFVQGRTLSEAIRQFHDAPFPSSGGSASGKSSDAERNTVEPALPRSPVSFQSVAFRNLLQRFIAVCNTVAFAHSKGVIHRDLKPSNVMIGDYGETLVLDWGLAKRIGESGPERNGVPASHCESSAEEEDEEHELTQQGQVLGTAIYMSPEQARGDAVDAATDIYALGAILYELLTGHRPYRGRNSAEVLNQLNAGPPPTPGKMQREVPRSLEAVCLKAMARAPVDRYASATELAREVDHWLADEPLLAYEETWLERASRWARKHRSWVIAAIVIFAVVVLALLTGLLIVTALNRELDQSNTDLTEALAREAMERQRAGASEGVARDAHREAEKQKQEAQDALADTQAYSEFLVQDLLSVARPGGERGGLGIGVTVQRALDEAAKNIDARFAGRPKAEALARHDLGVTYRLIGELEKAEEHLHKALALRRKALGKDDEHTLRTENSLAVVLAARGRYGDALPLYEEAYQRRKAKLGPEHPQTLTSLNNLASTYQAMGRTDEALPLLTEVLRLRKGQLGAEHTDTLTSMNNLARAYHALSRMADALALYEETLRLRKEHLGVQHPHTLISMDNLAIAYRTAGMLTEARQLFEEAWKLRQEVLGVDHPETLTSMSGLGTVYHALGQVKDALPLLEENLKLRSAKLGPTHSDTVTSMNNLANALRDSDRITEALTLYEQVLNFYGDKLGTHHPFTLTAMHNLGHAYQAAGRLHESLPLLEKALALRKEKLGPDHHSTLNSMSQLAVAYHAAGRNVEALALGQEALAARRVKLGPGHADTLITQRNLASVYVARRDYAEAERLLLDCQTRVEQNPTNMPRHLKEDTVPRLIRLYDRWGKHREAERWRQALSPTARLREALERDAVWPLFWGWPRF
jgi:serine/threonine protein kinase